MKVANAAPSPRQLLADHGLRATPVRLGVLAVLAGAAQPMDVPTILAKLPEHTDAVTVYRTLNTFTNTKLVHRVRGEDRSWRYAAGQANTPHRHPHFVCESCGKVECLESARVPGGLTRSLHVDDTYAISYAEVVLHGTCPKCR